MVLNGTDGRGAFSQACRLHPIRKDLHTWRAKADNFTPDVWPVQDRMGRQRGRESAQRDRSTYGTRHSAVASASAFGAPKSMKTVRADMTAIQQKTYPSGNPNVPV